MPLMTSINVSIRMRWWVLPLVRLLAFMPWRPNADTLARWIVRHGVKVAMA